MDWTLEDNHKRSQRGPCPLKYLEHAVLLCFLRRDPKQNNVIRLKSNILALQNSFGPPIFRTGYAAEDDMVDGLFFCKKLASRRGGHTLFAGVETPDTGAEFGNDVTGL